MTTNYATYQLEDFVNDDDFIQWVKYPNAESTAFWQNIIATYPYQKSVIERASRVVLQIQKAIEQPIDTHDVSEIWANIETSIEQNEKPTHIRRVKVWQWAVAASIALMVALGLWWSQNQSAMPNKLKSDGQNTQYTEGVEKKENLQDTPLQVALPDGSAVILEKNSSVEYATQFSSKMREVHLVGEALFDIVKNSEKPFVVYTDNLITKVLGTSFRIKAFAKDKDVTVNVLRGRVSVFSNKKEGQKDPETMGLILTPNQKVTFRKQDERLTRTLIEKPVVVVTQAELSQFVFDDAPISQIFSAIEKTYNVDIVFDEEVYKNCTLTTTLNNETLFDKLKIICKGIGATYKVVDAQVIIEGQSCN